MNKAKKKPTQSDGLTPSAVVKTGTIPSQDSIRQI